LAVGVACLNLVEHFITRMQQGILKLDDSLHLKSEIRNRKLYAQQRSLRREDSRRSVCDFGFRI